MKHPKTAFIATPTQSKRHKEMTLRENQHRLKVLTILSEKFDYFAPRRGKTMNKYKNTFTCNWCQRRFRSSVNKTYCSQFPCRSKYNLDLNHIREQVSFSRYSMERFCNSCGKHMGFFTERKWIKMQGICSACYISGIKNDVTTKNEVTPLTTTKEEE